MEAVRGTATGSSFGIGGTLAVNDVEVQDLPFATIIFFGRNVLFRK